MKKIGLLFLVFTLLVASTVVLFTGCGLFKEITVEEAKANLEAAGYEVTVMPGIEYVDSDDNPYPFILSSELDYYLYAVKGDDLIHIFFFNSIDIASQNYSFMNDAKLLSGQHNKVVYLATKQARTDAKV